MGFRAGLPAKGLRSGDALPTPRRRQETPLRLPGVERSAPSAAVEQSLLTPPAAAVPATWSPNAALRPFPRSSRLWPVPLEMDSSGSTRIPGAPSFL